VAVAEVRLSAKCTVAVDIGGTFTDGVLIGPDGSIVTAKVLSTPEDPSRGFFRVLEVLLEKGSASPADVGAIGHATTIATNAIIEGKLAPTALIVTKGFRDILEIARQNRPHLYDLHSTKPEPLVARDRVFEVDERMVAGGVVERPLDPDDARRVVREIVDTDVLSVVICLLHSYANPAHELELERLIKEAAPTIRVSRSSGVSPRLGEYARACTAALNARLLPVVAEYAEHMSDGLRERGFAAPVWMTQSSGGAMSLAAAAQQPVNIIESGPAAGIQGALQFGRLLGLSDLITLDMGGTTTKAAVVIDHQPILISEYEVGAYASGSSRAERGRGYPVNTTVIDVVEVGTGGGSIAWIDPGERFRVGPRSAGAAPGPACYALGGERPTVTDANIILGRIPIAEPLGGEIRLDPELARRAIDEHIARPLSLDVTHAAAGILEIAEASMARALYSVTVARGHDPRDFTVMAFGGAAPLHACAVAEQMGIGRVVIPPVPGVFSALGVVLADVRHDLVETHLAPLAETALPGLAAHLARLSDSARATVIADGVPGERVAVTCSVDVRYRGQSGTLTLTVNGLGVGEHLDLHRRFAELHKKTFGFADPADPVDVVSVRATGSGRRDGIASGFQTADAPRAQRVVETVIDHLSGPTRIPLVGRADLHAEGITGPVLILDSGSTTFVRPGWSLTPSRGCLVLIRGAQPGPSRATMQRERAAR